MSVPFFKLQKQDKHLDICNLEQGVFKVNIVFTTTCFLDSEQIKREKLHAKVSFKSSDSHIRIAYGLADSKLWYRSEYVSSSLICDKSLGDVIEMLIDLKQIMDKAQELIDEFFANDKSEGEE